MFDILELGLFMLNKYTLVRPQTCMDRASTRVLLHRHRVHSLNN